MSFANAHAAYENDVGCLLDKLQPEQLLYLKTVDFFGPGPMELIQGFDHRKACHANAALDRTILSQRGFPIGQFFQVVLMGPAVLCGLFGKLMMLFTHKRQLQIFEVPVKQGFTFCVHHGFSL